MIFLQAPEMGLEGIVSKRLSARYRWGPSRDWIKVKNPDSPARRNIARDAGNRPPRSWIEAQRGGYCRHRSELGKAQCGRLRRKVIVGNRSRALPSMKTSACKSPTVVASRTLSGTQAGLPRRAGSVLARERRWRSRRYGGGHTTARRSLDDITPLPIALARRQDRRRLCRPGRQRRGSW
jgi:hypothetical protein